jgi:hypothetical protein
MATLLATLIGTLLGLGLIGMAVVLGLFRWAAFSPRFGRWLVRTFPRYGHVFVDAPRDEAED